MPIAVVSAMDEEIQLYLDTCTVEQTDEVAGFTVYTARYGGHDVRLVKCGVGKTHAAMCTQILIDRYDASPVVCTGTAGAAALDLDIGDIVVARDCVHHDVDVRFLGIPRGQIPFTDLRFFETDPDLRAQAREVALADHTVRVGRVMTGDAFVQDAAYLETLRDELEGDCVEMEGAAVGQVCALNDVPYLVVRAISDRADGSSEIDFQEFLHDAARSSAQIVLHLLDAIDDIDAIDNMDDV
jgi:adenosylhomocysteine nucleosidase